MQGGRRVADKPPHRVKAHHSSECQPLPSRRMADHAREETPQPESVLFKNEHKKNPARAGFDGSAERHCRDSRDSVVEVATTHATTCWCSFLLLGKISNDALRGQHHACD